MNRLNWDAIRGVLPGPKAEYYRPGNLTKINVIEGSHLQVSREFADKWRGHNNFALCFCGGMFLSEYSSHNLPDGVVFQRIDSPLKLVARENKQSAFQRWGQGLPFHYQLKIAAGVKLSTPIWQIDICNKGSPGFAATSIDIQIGKDAEVEIVRVLANDLPQHHQFIFTNITLAESARASIATIADTHSKSWGLDRTEIHQDKNSQLSHYVFTSGGEYFRQELEINLNGEESTAKAHALMLGQGVSLTDHTTRIAHHVGNTSGQQYYKAILDESSRAVFKGNFFVHPLAQKVNSSQLNKTLLLTNSCEILARPQLEIYADDVKCSHGATVGELDEQELFYLQSRGISADRARIMLANGMAQEIINDIGDEKLRSFISHWCMNKLSAMNSLNQTRGT